MSKSSAIIVALFVPLAVCPGVQAGVIAYTIMDLGTLGGTSSYAAGMNDIGQVVGHAYPPGDGTYHAFRTAPNSPINPATDDLGTLAGGDTYAKDINDAGAVVGYAWHPTLVQRGFRTAPNSPINAATDDIGDLGGLGWRMSAALAIDTAGRVVGWADTDPYGTHAFRTAPYTNIVPITDDLGTLYGNSWAADINDAGQVVGISGGGYDKRSFRTAPNSPIDPDTDDLGTLGGQASWAFGINASGQVVGRADTAGGFEHAFRTAPNSPIDPATDDLGTLGGAGSGASDINNAGYVVGRAQIANGEWHAFVCYGGQSMVDLNDLTDPASGWTLTSAGAINNHGQIVGSGSIGGATHAYLLTVVPEPVAGDANYDGCVDGLDYVIWSTNYDPLAGGTAWWWQGDFNGDGYVDGLDYVVWSSNYLAGCPGSPGAVPEPASAVLLVLGALAIRRRRHSA